MHPTKRRILCAEPHEDTCSMLKHLLERSNYDIKLAKTVADTLRLARSQRFNLYLLSGIFDDGTGIELCRQLRGHDPHTPILFFSAYGRETDRQSGMNAGAQGYLTKPGDIFELSATITRLIDHAECPASEEIKGVPAPSATGAASPAAQSEWAAMYQIPIHDVERRGKPRICEPFPATVFGADASGEEFETKTILDNLSASGLYMRLGQCIEQGAKLSIVIRPSIAPINEAPAPSVAVNGVVLRSESRPDGSCGVGVMLHNTDFFETWSWALRH